MGVRNQPLPNASWRGESTQGYWEMTSVTYSSVWWVLLRFVSMVSTKVYVILAGMKLMHRHSAVNKFVLMLVNN